jgi:hypothetical protein
MIVTHISIGPPLEEKIGYSRAVVVDCLVVAACTTGYD